MADDVKPDEKPDDKPDEKPDDPQAEIKKWRDLSRKHEAEAKKNADAAKKLEAIEAASKSDLEKANEAQTAAERRTTDLERQLARTNVALSKGLTASQAKRLVGDTQEELEADADELLSTFKPADGDDGRGGTGIPRRPAERMAPGAKPDTEPEPKEEDLAAAIQRKQRGY